MTTQQIVNALRCCAEPSCNECPLKPTNSTICLTDDMMREAANLIEAQDELIKMLREQVEQVREE